MSLQIRITLITIILALMSFVHVSTAIGQQKVLTNEQTQIVGTGMFTGLRTDDAAKLNSIITPRGEAFTVFPSPSEFQGPWSKDG